jgi:purine catabolism regulator
MDTMLTLRSFTQNPELHLTVLVPGAPGALDAQVSWVHNTELPDPSPYVRERELVLTNGMWFDDGCTPREFVENVQRAKAAGIVFGLRKSVVTTPPTLIEACRSARMPLLELVIEIPFTALSQAAAAAYAEEQHSSLRASVHRGIALAEAISSDAGVPGALRVLRQEYDLPLAVVDRMGRPLALAGIQLTDGDLHRLGDALTAHPPPLEVQLSAAGTATIFPIGVPGEVTTALVCLRRAATLGEAELAALQQTAHFLSMEVARKRAIEATEMRFAAELIEQIASGMGDSTELAQRLRGFGVDPTTPLAVATFAHAGGGDPVTPALVEAARAAHIQEGIPSVFVPGSRDVIALFSWERPSGELRPWLDTLVTALERRCSGRRTVLGFSAPVQGHARLRAPLRTAREACQTLARQPAGPRIASLAELPTHIALLSNLDPSELRRFADAVLEPLRNYDTARDARLEDTLRAFLAREGQFKDTSEALFIHVNTLRKRLTRIAELTGRDPHTFEGRVDLFLALRADTLIMP